MVADALRALAARGRLNAPDHPLAEGTSGNVSVVYTRARQGKKPNSESHAADVQRRLAERECCPGPYMAIGYTEDEPHKVLLIAAVAGTLLMRLLSMMARSRN